MTYLVMNNIRSTYNVGAIFRTADAVGVSRIYLTGYTPAPLDRFGRERKDIAKVSLGAEKTVPWESMRSLPSLIQKLKKDGVTVIAVEQDDTSVDYKKIQVRSKTALIFGNEVSGIPKAILTRCDAVAEIPMRGKKESLNVSVSAGIVLFRLLDR